jgi:hypothetical protein
MKVRDFQRLAKLSEADGHLQQKLKQLLKLSKEKWDSACEHAKTAVQVSRIRYVWACACMRACVHVTCECACLHANIMQMLKWMLKPRKVNFERPTTFQLWNRISHC